ncbi:YozQ family protein [Evansella sp. AB-rgal1]|uniref:YozQ family protein n=1 Tax=Evansella sp. AB-rgal1 TaxID=3242696 RepID=UPI00359CDAC7
MNKKTDKKSEKIAEKSYEPANYQSNDETEKGLAITHEQVSDAYMEGTIDGSIDQVDKNGELKSDAGEKIKRKGFDE